MSDSMPPAGGLTVAITGPTGDIGRSFIRELERHDEVGRIVGLARRPIDPAAHGWERAEYHRGDVLDRGDVEALVDGADVVVHLAFIIVGGHEEARRINLEGSRNVFEAAIGAGAKRLVYASSVAAYGFHEDNPQPLTEELPPRGTERFYYSAHKAELEGLLSELIEDAATDAYVFRPSIVAGPDAVTLMEQIPYVRLAAGMPSAARNLLELMPVLKPALPDPGVPIQLVHHDDVATALAAAVLGHGPPGVYNLAADGVLSMHDVADELGWYSISVPELAVDAAAEIASRIPFLPPEAAWLEALRVPVVMNCSKARRELGWEPAHDGPETLHELVAAAREALPGLS